MSKVFIYDTETTGLLDNRLLKLSKQPEIIEFYGVLADLSTGEELAEVESFFEPVGEVSEEITKITGITPEMVRGAPRFAERSDAIAGLIENAPAVLAHNLSFDVEMVELEFERLGRTIAWPRKLCTVEQSIHLKGFRLSLSALHEHLFGEPFAGAHRAKVDVAALKRCAVELYARGCL